MYQIVLFSEDKDYKELLESYFANKDFDVKNFSEIDSLRNYLNLNHVDILLYDLFFSNVSINQIELIIANKKVEVIALNDTFDNMDLEMYFEASIKEFINKKSDIKLLEQRMNNMIQLKSRNQINGNEKEQGESIGKTIIKIEDGIVYKNSMPVSISKLELIIVELLLNNKNIILSRKKIFKEAWFQENGNLRNVDTCIKNIRKKLEVDSIITVYGKGYVWKE